MRTERAVTAALIKAAVIIAAAFVLYAVVAEIDRAESKRTGRPGFVRRALDVFNKVVHVRPPYLSEEEVRRKVREYVR